MGLIPDSIKDDWENIVQQLNVATSGLGVTCQLIFDAQIISTSSVVSDNVGLKPKVMLPFGGRQNLNELIGHENTNNNGIGSQGLKQQINTKNIHGRVYPVLKPYERMSLGLAIDVSAWQLTTEKKYIPDIMRAKEAIFNYGLAEKEIRVKLEKPPVPYGLGRAFQCKSIWIEI